MTPTDIRALPRELILILLERGLPLQAAALVALALYLKDHDDTC